MKFSGRSEALAFSKEASSAIQKNSLTNLLSDFLINNPQIDKLITPELLSAISSWVWKEDAVHTKPEIGLAVASAFYGKNLADPGTVYSHAQEFFSPAEVPDISRSSGFDELYQLTSGLTDEQYLLVEAVVAQHLLSQALESLGKSANDLDLLLLATTHPISENLRKAMAQAVGVRPHVPVILYSKACDSSGSALYDVLRGIYDPVLQDKLKNGGAATIGLFAYEDLHRAKKVSSDPYSKQLFSTGASGLVFQYGNSGNSTFSKVAGATHAEQNGVGCIKYPETYKNWSAQELKWVVKAPYVIEPDSDVMVEMDSFGALRYFGPNAVKVVQFALSDYQEKSGIPAHELAAKIKKAIIHHPSLPIFNSLVDKLAGTDPASKRYRPGLGFNRDMFEWVIPEGNVPSATIPIALGRQLYDLETGDVIMVLSFGAGGSFTCGFYKIGAVS